MPEPRASSPVPDISSDTTPVGGLKAEGRNTRRGQSVYELWERQTHVEGVRQWLPQPAITPPQLARDLTLSLGITDERGTMGWDVPVSESFRSRDWLDTNCK